GERLLRPKFGHLGVTVWQRPRSRLLFEFTPSFCCRRFTSLVVSADGDQARLEIERWKRDEWVQGIRHEIPGSRGHRPVICVEAGHDSVISDPLAVTSW